MAYLLYLVLYLAWAMTPLQTLYLGFLSMAGTGFLRAVAHFPAVPGMAAPDLETLHTHAVLLAAIFLVSTGVPIRRRIRLFGWLFAGLLALDFVSATASLELQTVRNALAGPGVLLLLPVEYNVLEGVWYLAYTIPLQAAPFALLAFSLLLNGGILRPAGERAVEAERSGESAAPARPGEGPGRRGRLRPVLLTAALAGLAVAAMAVWLRIRESRPLHSQAHVRLGDIFFDQEKLAAARLQYRAAVTGDPGAGRAWYRLAQIAVREGDHAEAARILGQAAGAVREAPWADRIRAAREEIAAVEDRPWDPIVVVPPPGTP